MPLDYSKWDNLEISDDEDIECHPNVDKKSFIRWRQEKMHRDRAERKQKIVQLKERIELSDKVIKRIQDIIEALKNRGDIDIQKKYEEIYHRAMDDRNKLGVIPADANKYGHQQSFEQTMVNLLAQVRQDVNENSNSWESEAVINKLKKELDVVTKHRDTCKVDLAKEEKIENSTLTTDNICKPGFDKTVINKQDKPKAESVEEKKAPIKKKEIEILNPKTLETTKVDSNVLSKFSPSAMIEEEKEDEVINVSSVALSFSELNHLNESLSFISKHPFIIDERYYDQILTHAFELELKGDTKGAHRCVRQGLIIQYCTKLGGDGVNAFFRNIGERGAGAFNADVEETYKILKERCRILASKREEESEEKAVFQLEPADDNAQIAVDLPTDAPEDEERRKLFESLPVKLQESLKTGNLTEINAALAQLDESIAENALQTCDQGGFLSFVVPSDGNELN